jgi:hypothetical protein
MRRLSDLARLASPLALALAVAAVAQGGQRWIP